MSRIRCLVDKRDGQSVYETRGSGQCPVATEHYITCIMDVAVVMLCCGVTEYYSPLGSSYRAVDPHGTDV